MLQNSRHHEVSHTNRPTAMNGSTYRRPKEFRERYSTKSPPLNFDAALDRIEILEKEIATIECKLDFAEMPHLSNDEYYDWRDRAIKALSYKKPELKYLQGYTAEQAIISVRNTADTVQEAFKKSLPDREKARKSARERTAIGRLKQIEGWQNDLCKSLAPLHRWGNYYRLSDEAMRAYKAPALDVLSALQSEILTIKASVPKIVVRLSQVA